MMEKLLLFFLGEAAAEIRGLAAADALNLCARDGIAFQNPVCADGALRLRVRRRDLGALRGAVEAAGGAVRVLRIRGVLPKARKLRKRWLLAAGLLLAVAAVWGSSLFIWQISVSGNETVRTEEILAVLEDLGVGIGTCRLRVNQDDVSNEVLQRLSGLSWIAVNISGSRASVLVREEIPAPAITDAGTPVLICAAKAGVVDQMTVLSGSALCAPGDTVQAGDVLVTGRMDSIASGTRFVHALAEIKARTWYTLSAVLPLKAQVKTAAGAGKTRRALLFGAERLNLYFDSGIYPVEYDRICTNRRLSFLGSPLPVSAEKTTIFPAALRETAVDAAAARALLEERLTARLCGLLGESGRVVSRQFESAEENGALLVTLRAECLESIGTERPMTPAEMLPADTQN